MKLLQIKDLTDEQWDLYALFTDEFDKKHYPDEIKERTNPADLKKERLYDLEILKSDFLKTYLILDGGKAMGSFGIRLSGGDAEFMLQVIYDKIPDELIHKVFEIIKVFVSERGKKEIISYSNDKVTIKALEDSGGKVIDKKIFTRLMKSEIDKDELKKIIESVTEKINYKLIFFDTIPEELIDKYLPVYNDARKDMNQNNPNPVKFVLRTREDVINKLKWDKGPKDRMMVYMLFDNDNIAAFSSLFIRNESKRMIDHAGGLTTVARNYRGKNLARFLKVKLYLKVLEEYPDFDYIRTDTYPWNKYMYRINEEMGFKPYDEYSTLIWDYDFE